MLAALLGIGWVVKRQSGSHRTLLGKAGPTSPSLSTIPTRLGVGCSHESPKTPGFGPRTSEVEGTQEHFDHVSFEEASTVFYDEQALEMEDPDEVSGEDRFVIIGLSARLRLLAVCHCVRKGNQIRIISARRAVKAEQNQYWQRLNR